MNFRCYLCFKNVALGQSYKRGISTFFDNVMFWDSSDLRAERLRNQIVCSNCARVIDVDNRNKIDIVVLCVLVILFFLLVFICR